MLLLFNLTNEIDKSGVGIWPLRDKSVPDKELAVGVLGVLPALRPIGAA